MNPHWGAPRAACGKFMLRLATYKKTKKKSEAKKGKKKSDAKRLKERDRKSEKKKKKARRVLLTKNKSYKKTDLGFGAPRERERVALSGPPHPLFFFFLGSVK